MFLFADERNETIVDISNRKTGYIKQMNRRLERKDRNKLTKWADSFTKPTR